MLFNFKISKKRQEETRKRIEKMSTEISRIWSGEDSEIQTDINGSYTGRPKKDETPVQDADDL